eukprot:TRINITY_DN40507_c0_g1_i2.p1 TRINITY_DN40507_c0_g1~~TRINITY_DN40507_c0_g1_i2.p1  ORF type:complete len:158 (-),score=18.93 TRINITY_DN40507_c0_g1_i2:526-999(-)
MARSCAHCDPCGWSIREDGSVNPFDVATKQLQCCDKQVCRVCYDDHFHGQRCSFCERSDVDADSIDGSQVAEAVLSQELDNGRCTECKEDLPFESHPLRFEDGCLYCDQKPAFHHGRCCPERLLSDCCEKNRVLSSFRTAIAAAMMMYVIMEGVAQS